MSALTITYSHVSIEYLVQVSMWAIMKSSLRDGLSIIQGLKYVGAIRVYTNTSIKDRWGQYNAESGYQCIAFSIKRSR